MFNYNQKCRTQRGNGITRNTNAVPDLNKNIEDKSFKDFPEDTKRLIDSHLYNLSKKELQRLHKIDISSENLKTKGLQDFTPEERERISDAQISALHANTWKKIARRELLYGAYLGALGYGALSYNPENVANNVIVAGMKVKDINRKIARAISREIPSAISRGISRGANSIYSRYYDFFGGDDIDLR